MAHNHKPLNQQVMVITGASSGIGLATAEAAAAKGARLVLGARSVGALNQLVSRIRANDGEAIAVECDVSDPEQVLGLADAAIQHFGRIDTWVNNAGISIYGRLDEVTEEDSRRLFDTNFWGVYYGSLAALPHLTMGGGALINVGSEVSEAVVPLQGLYSASKHAVKGFTDALRVEIEELDRAPVSITLIQPTAVDTPFPQHARNYMDQEPKLPDPKIDPDQVAEAILDAAVTPVRSKKVGTISKINTALSKLVPRMGDKVSASMAGRQQEDRPARDPEGALYRPSEATHVVGRARGPGRGDE